MKRLALLGLLLGATACTPRVQLSAPPASAPIEARQQAYQQLRPAGVTQDIVVTSNRFSANASLVTRSLVLANGMEVFHPADLLPVVRQTSITTGHIMRWERKRRIGNILLGAGAGASILGVSLMIVDLVNDDGEVFGPLFITGGIIALVGAVVSLAGRFVKAAAANHRRSAFQSYDSSLQERLQLQPANQMQPMAPRGAPMQQQPMQQPTNGGYGDSGNVQTVAPPPQPPQPQEGEVIIVDDN